MIKTKKEILEMAMTTMKTKRVQAKRATWMMVKKEASIVKLRGRTKVLIQEHQLRAMASEISIAPVKRREASGSRGFNQLRMLGE